MATLDSTLPGLALDFRWSFYLCHFSKILLSTDCGVRVVICDSCGCKNNNVAKNCISCGASLKPRMSKEELSAMIDRLSDRSDALTASRFENKLKWIFFSLAPIILILCVTFSKIPVFGVIAAVFAIIAGIFAGYPKIIWEIEKLRISIYAHADDATPTDFWSFERKILYWMFIAIAIALAIMSLLIE